MKKQTDEQIIKTTDVAIPKSLFKRLKPNFQRKFYANNLLVNMELRNGDWDSFIVQTNNTTFKYKGGDYVLDDELKYYNRSAKMWCLDYHQDISIPIKRKVPSNNIKKAIKDLIDIDMAINPTSLISFIESSVIEKVMKGQEIDDELKKIKLMIIIILVCCIILVGAMLQSSGVLENLNLPF